MADGSLLTTAFFDFGGVLTTPVWDSFSAFCEKEGLDPAAIKNLFKTDPEALALLRKLEKGEMEESEFESHFGEKLGLKDHPNLIDSMFEGMGPDERMVGAVRELREAGVKTGLISNSWSTAHYDRELLADIFDTVVISGEVGLHKPEPEIYLRAAREAQAEPADCLFVDDLAENCEGAEAVGMTPVRHREASKTIPALAELTGVKLTPPKD